MVVGVLETLEMTGNGQIEIPRTGRIRLWIRQRTSTTVGGATGQRYEQRQYSGAAHTVRRFSKNHGSAVSSDCVCFGPVGLIRVAVFRPETRQICNVRK